MFLFHSSARVNDHSPNVTRKMIDSHRICMELEVIRKRDDICQAFRVPTSKKGNLSYLSCIQCSHSSHVSIWENRLKFLLLRVSYFFFFDETVFPLLLLNSCEDYSSGSDTVTNRKGKCMMKLLKICRVYNIYVSIDILCKPTEAFPVSLSLQD